MVPTLQVSNSHVSTLADGTPVKAKLTVGIQNLHALLSRLGLATASLALLLKELSERTTRHVVSLVSVVVC